jgi:hypothetical protein
MATQFHHEIISTAPPPSTSLVDPNVSSFNHVAINRSLAKTKTKLIRPADRDYSQGLRWGYQFAFLLMNVWLGGQFYLWVRQYETAGQTAYVARPAGVEGWLPIAGMMEPEIFSKHGAGARTASGSHVSAGDVRSHGISVSQGVLQLAMPGGNVLGVLGEAGQEIVRPEFSFGALGRYSVARAEVFVAGIFCVGGFEHVG